MPIKYARFEHTQHEVGTGGPGYRWAPAVYIITPEGEKLYPPVGIREARAICKIEGWKIEPKSEQLAAQVQDAMEANDE